MSRPDAEQEQHAAPGAGAKAALRVVDACLGYFQRLHDRLAGATEHHRQGRHADSRQEADEATPAKRPSVLRRLLVALLLLLVGGGTSALLVYRTLSAQIKEHADVVERLQEEMDATRKEDARNVKLLDKFQRENAEYRHDAREAQREAEIAKARSAALEEEIESMKRAEQAAREAREAAAAKAKAKASAPPKGGKCTVGTSAEIAACIERFNHP
jgi:hypothetical protein